MIHRTTSTAEKGSFKCQHPKCLCCREILHKGKNLFINTFRGGISINHHVTCQTSCIIYQILCCCGHQYVGRTTQKLHTRINRHRANIQNKFLLHGLSRHCTIEHPNEKQPFRGIPIDHIKAMMQNRFDKLKKLEIYWMYRLKTLQPIGLPFFPPSPLPLNFVILPITPPPL